MKLMYTERGMGRYTQGGGKSRRSILLIEDHPIVSRGLADLINFEPDLWVCGAAEDGALALQQVEALAPDLVVLDLSLGGRGGLDVLKDIKARYPRQRVLILSMHDEGLYASRALRAGACGYVMKQEATDTLLRAIRQVLDGGVYLSERMAKALVHGWAKGGVASVSDPLESLTDRELEVFQLIGRGKSAREIAEQLHLSVKTIESHRTQIKQKLGVNTVNNLIRRAVQVEQELSAVGRAAAPL